MDFLKNIDFELLNSLFLGNSVKDYIVCIIILFIGLLFKKTFSKYISKFLFDFILKSKKVNSSNFYSIVKKPLDYTILLIFIYLSINHLDLSFIFNLKPGLETLFSKLFSLLIMILIIWFLLRIQTVG